MTSVKLATVAAALLVAVGLSGCSAISTDVAAPSPEPQNHTTFPLDEYLGQIWGIGLSDEQRFAAEQAQWQRSDELVGQCMHEAGFEFDPDNLPGIMRAEGEFIPTDRLRPNDRDWVMQYGYGIVLGAELGTFIPWDPDLRPGEHDLSPAELAAN